MLKELSTDLNSKYLTINQAKDYMKCGKWFLARLRKNGKVTSIKAGKKVLLEKESIDRYLQSNIEVPA